MIMKTKNNEAQNKRPKIVLPKVSIKDLATLNEGKAWPKKGKLD